MAASLESCTQSITASSDEVLMQHLNVNGDASKAVHDLLIALSSLCNTLLDANQDKQLKATEKTAGHSIIPCIKRQKAPQDSNSNSNRPMLPCPPSLLTAMDIVYSLDEEKIIQEVVKMFKGPVSRIIAPCLSDPSLSDERSIASQHQAAYASLAPHAQSWMWSLVAMAMRFYQGTGISCLSLSFLHDEHSFPLEPTFAPLLLTSLFSHIILGLSQGTRDGSLNLSAQDICHSIIVLSGIGSSFDLSPVSPFKSLIQSLSIFSSHPISKSQTKELSSSFSIVFKTLGGLDETLIHCIHCVLKQAMEKLQLSDGGSSDVANRGEEGLAKILSVMGQIDNGSPGSTALARICRTCQSTIGKGKGKGKELHPILFRIAELMFADDDATGLAQALILWLSPEADLPLESRLFALSKLSSMAADPERETAGLNWGHTNVHQALAFTLSHDSAVRTRRAAISLLVALHESSSGCRGEGGDSLLVLSTLLQKCRDKDEAVRFRGIQSILKSDPKMIRNLADQKGEGVVLDLSMFIRGSLTMIARGQAKKDVLKTLLVALIRGNQSIASALRLPLSIFDIFK